jgi:hypothetical protein
MKANLVLLVTAAIATSHDLKTSPSDARDRRLNGSAATDIARPDFPPEPTTTIGLSWQCASTAPDGAASASNVSRLVAHSNSTHKTHLSPTIVDSDRIERSLAHMALRPVSTSIRTIPVLVLVLKCT